MSLEDALGFFYHSFTYQLMREGVSDMHARSDGYLVEELMRELAKRDRDSAKGE